MLWHTVQSETMQSVCNDNQSEIKPSKKADHLTCMQLIIVHTNALMLVRLMKVRKAK